MTNMSKPKFKNKFWIGLIIVVILWLGALAFGLSYLWNIMAEYEISTAKHALSAVENMFGAENFDELVGGGAFEKNAYESDEELVSVYEAQLENGDLTYARLVKPGEDESQDYVVKSGEVVVGELTLAFEDSGTFGKWNITNTKAVLPIWGDIVVRMPTNAKLFVNGLEVGEEYISQTDMPYDELEFVTENYEVPTQVEYTLTGFYNMPEVAATDFNGNPLTVTLNEEATWDVETQSDSTITTLYAEVKPAQVQGDLTALHDMAISDAKKYSFYLSEDGSFTSIANRMIRESKIYNNIRTMETMWYTNHTHVTFTNEATTNFQQFTSDIFTVDVDYLYTVYRSGGLEYPFETNIKIVYANVDGDWKITDIQIR